MHRRLPLSAASILFALAAVATSGEIGFIEDFALAPDRQQALDQLIPGTEDYYYYTCLHLQSRQRYDEVERVLAAWIERHNVTPRVREIQHRQALLTYPQHPQQTLTYLRRQLGLQLNHQRETVDQAALLPTQLDPALISRDRLRHEALQRHPDTLNGFEDAALEWMAATELDAARRRDLLQRIRRPDVAGLAQLVADDLSAPNSPGFGAFPIHRDLLLSQLDELLQLRPALRSETHFVNTYVTKLQPDADVDWQHVPAQRQAYLARLWSFVTTLSPAHNSLRAHVLYHQLAADQMQGTYDREKFLAYLALPRLTPYMNPTYLETAEHRQFPCNLGEDFSAITQLPPVGDDEPLVRQYLQHFFVDDADYDAYKPFVSDVYLKHLFAETKIVNGLGDPETWYALLPPQEYQQLKERVDIDFAPTNPRLFAADDAVTLDLLIKNVPTLIVKVYRINALNYYKDQAGEINTGLNLDGLVANEELTFNYSEPPLRRVPRRFHFPALARPGIYMIDFIGNGKSSRVLIHKGRLHYLLHTTAAGHAFAILDEQNRPLDDATLWMGGQLYQPGPNGQIVVPYSTSPGRQPIVMVHGDVATLDAFDHEAEQYSLQAGFYLDRESLLAGRVTQALVRPGLTVNGVPVSRTILEHVRLDLTSVDLDGVSTTDTVSDLTLSDDQDLVHSFRVPPRLASITLTLRGQVKSLSTNRPIDVQAAQTFALNEIEKTPAIEDLHFSRSGTDYVVDVFGRTGEPRANRPIALTLKHEDFRDPVQVTLRSDEAGRIHLGALDRISWVTATGPEGTEHQWPLRPDRQSCGQSLHGLAGETLDVPCVVTGEAPSRQQLSLLEVRGGTYVADRFDALSIDGGTLRISGLEPGDYDLLLKPLGQRIQVRITAGSALAGYAVGAFRQLELRGRQALQIRRVEVNDQELTVALRNASSRARVHIFATELQPAYSAYDQLAALRDAEPSWSRLGRAAAIYLAGRRIGDEFRYVLDRKYARKFAGNMLTRPALLLNPWAVRDTQTGQEQLQLGDEFAAEAPAPAADAGRDAAGEAALIVPTDFAALDFLAQPSIVLLNVQPDAQGEVRIPRQQLAGKQMICVVAVDAFTTSCRSVALPAATPQHVDLRLLRPLDPASHFSQQKQISILSAGETFVLHDVRAGKFALYDSLARVYQLYETLLPGSHLAEFRFLLRWHQLDDTEKREYYSRYACHELNFFLHRKDPEFFRSAVQPYLRNKLHKTFLDHYLLEDDLSAYLAPWQYAQLNVVERILLGQRIAAERAVTARQLTDAFQLIPPDIDRFNLLFDTALRGHALAAEDSLGLSEAMEEARSAPPMGALGDGAVRFGMPGGGAGRDAGVAGRRQLMRREEMDRAAQLEGEGVEAADEPALAPPAPAALGVHAPNGAPGESAADLFFDNAIAEDVALRKQAALKRLFQPLDQTKEWAENNYYQLPITAQTADLVTVNAFWVDLATHDPEQPFLSTHLAEASRSFSEALFALSFLDLPPESPQHDADVADGAAQVKLHGAAVVFHEQIQPTHSADDAAPVLVSQNFFRQGDRYRQEQNEQVDKFITDEFLVQTVYGGLVVVTNPTSSRRKLDVLIQVPEGAIPVNNGQYTKNTHVQLEPYRTEALEFYFYFPAPGEFRHFPVHVAREDALVAAADPQTFHVVHEPTQIDRTSWPYLSQHGTDQDVLDYLRRENLNAVDLDRIAFRMHDKGFFQQTLAILGERHLYNHTLWSYALAHDEPSGIREFLSHCDDFVVQCGDQLESPLLTIDPVLRRRYEHLEYGPLVNARAHQIGPHRQILNDRFHEQYQRWLKVLSYARQLSDQDRLATAYYLLLQDRLADAEAQFQQVDPARLATRLQYDYCQAYLAMSAGDVETAARIAGQYEQHPVDRWRNAFAAVRSHLDEIAGRTTGPVDPLDRSQTQDQLAAQQPSFEFSIQNKAVQLDYHNVSQVRVNYYRMDIELLFSRNPFVQRHSGQFSYIQPNLTQTVDLPADQSHLELPLPESLLNQNVLVEIEGAGLRRSEACYSNSLHVQVIENYGQVRVTDAATSQPLATVYVKVYAQLNDGRVQFYKDGYTDLRGRFDYATLSTNLLDGVSKFAILVLSEQQGALVREADPPKR